MEGIYEDWAEERRNFYSEQFGRVTSALAKLELAEKRLASAKKYAEETLTVDPYREDIHRVVMKILSAQGKPAAVKKHFDAMQELPEKRSRRRPFTRNPPPRRRAFEMSRLEIE
jgi:DNA-binding SARP family transcriptional activator